ncbi:MAG: hypothetical protein IJB36_01610 [Clostridia bacterium]|nr:hypothetical protein [Clostridia bacterium]
MHTCKRIVALLMTLALLACVPVAVSAEETASEQVFVQVEENHSITTEEETGNGLAFLFRLNVKGAAVNSYNEFVNDNAVTTINGEEYRVVAMGAVMTNQAEYIAQIDTLTREDKNEERTILDVSCRYMFEVAEDTCAFAVRIIRVHDEVKGFAVAARPYCVVKDAEGNESTIYGDSDIATYNQVYYANVPEETPVLDLSALDNVDDKIAASASAEYVAYAPTTYRESFKVSLTLNNVSANAKTSVGDYVTYSCKDAEGNVLGSEKVAVDALNPGESKTVEFYAPMGTAAIEAVESKLTYVPVITLPAIGSDIDVTKKKNRIRVSAASASFNEDGTIHVELTFKNYTSNWITEETDYVKYTYYNAAGTKIDTGTIYIGVIDTKKHPVKTFAFDLPATAASVKITSSRITYWTEWA